MTGATRPPQRGRHNGARPPRQPTTPKNVEGGAGAIPAQAETPAPPAPSATERFPCIVSTMPSWPAPGLDGRVLRWPCCTFVPREKFSHIHLHFDWKNSDPAIRLTRVSLAWLNPSNSGRPRAKAGGGICRRSRAILFLEPEEGFIPSPGARRLPRARDEQTSPEWGPCLTGAVATPATSSGAVRVRLLDLASQIGSQELGDGIPRVQGHVVLRAVTDSPRLGLVSWLSIRQRVLQILFSENERRVIPVNSTQGLPPPCSRKRCGPAPCIISRARRHCQAGPGRCDYS